MPRSFYASARLLLVAAGLSAMFSGCTMYHALHDATVGTPRVGATVNGPLRIPVENQQDLARPVAPPAAPPVMMPPPPPAAVPPPQAVPPAANPAGANPYDYYDQQGHPVAPKETAHPPAPQSRLWNSAPKSSPEMVAWLFGSDNEPLSPADKAAEKAPYPKLSSVPPTPPELQAARAADAQGTQQLQDDWQAAQQEKTTLDGEPSSLPPAPQPQAAPATN